MNIQLPEICQEYSKEFYFAKWKLDHKVIEMSHNRLTRSCKSRKPGKHNILALESSNSAYRRRWSTQEYEILKGWYKKNLKVLSNFECSRLWIRKCLKILNRIDYFSDLCGLLKERLFLANSKIKHP